MSEQLGLLGDNTPRLMPAVMRAAQHRHSDPPASRAACERFRIRLESHDATVLRAVEIAGPATYHDLRPFVSGLADIQVRRALDRLKLPRRRVVDGQPVGPILRPALVYIVREDEHCSCGCGQSIQSWALTGHVTG